MDQTGTRAPWDRRDPRTLLRLFSTRRRQIEAEFDRTGQTGPAAAQRACLTTRPARTNVPEQSLRDRWDAQTRAAGYDPHRLVYGLLGRQRPPAAPDITALQTELLGPAGVSSLAVLRGASLRPVGDVVLADIAREGANDLVDRLRDLGVHKRGPVHIEPVQACLSQRGFDAERGTPGSSADAVVWTDVTQRA